MTIPFQKERYTARFTAGPDDLLACQRLRHACFFGRDGTDTDAYDAKCQHLMVADEAGRLVATVRLFVMKNGAEVDFSYAAQCYDLYKFYSYNSPLMELGRFCISDDVMDADVLRAAWGALTQVVDAQGVAMLFGCTSFQGTDPARYGRAFKRLHLKHLGPDGLRPRPQSDQVIPFAGLTDTGTDPMPPLLRTYLAMGGWVSDHAVMDRAMNTMHVFTALEVATVPPARAQALRALAKACPLA
jgi:putative hemolysin